MNKVYIVVGKDIDSIATDFNQCVCDSLELATKYMIKASQDDEYKGYEFRVDIEDVMTV